VKVSLHDVEPELARLWKEEADRGGAPRIALFTVVALASELAVLERAEKVVAAVASAYPSRTIVAVCMRGADDAITAETALHRIAPRGSPGSALLRVCFASIDLRNRPTWSERGPLADRPCR